RTVVVNLGANDRASRGGPLVHELTHALMDFDFPQAPAWLAEGLASLHEDCQLVEGELQGSVNWRLAGLQRTMHINQLRSLAALLGDGRFGVASAGADYAQARYFCLYLQRRGVLAEFYHTFRDRYPRDPSAAAPLGRALPGFSWR